MNKSCEHRKPYDKRLNIFALFSVVLLMLIKKFLSFFYDIEISDKYPFDPLLDILLLSCILGYISNIIGATTPRPSKIISILLILLLLGFYFVALVEPLSRGINWAKSYMGVGVTLK
jgi:hypothetical protein